MSHAKQDGAVHVVDNGFSKGWLLAILVLLVAQVAFIKLITRENATITAPLPSAELDDQGRAIVFLGDLQLHVPEHLWWSSGPPRNMVRDYIPLLMCWQDETTSFGVACPRHADIRIFVLYGGSTLYFPYTDAHENLISRTKTYVGPIESEIEGVNIYRHATRGFALAYALTTIDPSGRFPYTYCNPLYCTVRARVHAQVYVHYSFNKELVANWPQIHAGVREAAVSMIPDQ